MSNSAKADTRRGRRRPSWKREFLRSLQQAAIELPPLSDDEILKLVDLPQGVGVRPKITIALKA